MPASLWGQTDTICAAAPLSQYHVKGLPGSTFFWTLSDPTLSIQGQGSSNISIDWKGRSGIYTLEVTETNAEGCSGQPVRLTVFVTDEVCEPCEAFFVPNAFAPGPEGNPENDCWKLYGGECIAEMNLAVYSRWGEKVYESTSPASCWDGTSHGRPLNPDVFVYFIEARLISGKQESRHGRVTLIR